MKLSARNQISGTVTSVDHGPVTAKIKIDIGGNIITSVISNEAAEELALTVGDTVSAVIKSSDVMIAK